MKCVICNSSDVQMKKVDEEIRSEKDILLIPMEVLVCLGCGERYYDRKAMRRIEEVRTKLKSHDLKVKEVGKVWVEQAAYKDLHSRFYPFVVNDAFHACGAYAVSQQRPSGWRERISWNSGTRQRS